LTPVRALIHVQHLLGVGHFMRARQLVAALARAGCETTLMSGGMPVAHAPMPDVRFVQLPPIRVADATFAPLLDAASRPIDDAYRERRRDLVLRTLDETQPAVMIVETFPFGRRALRFELVPLLERAHAMQPKPIVLASLRDILQRPGEGRERGMFEMAQRWFDGLLVHGDPRLVRFEDSFGPDAPLELAPPVHYTGYVVDPAGLAPTLRARNEIVVSAGGGAVGLGLLQVALAAQPLSRHATLTWRLLVGGNLPDASFGELRAACGPRTVVERARPDFADLLATALVSVSQCGYNTALDVLRSGTRAVFVPFAAGGQTEQPARAARLASHSLAHVVDEARLTPATLAAAVDAAAAAAAPSWTFAADGATRTAEIVAAMLSQRDAAMTVPS
jgi:predicted glycosyltransferase